MINTILSAKEANELTLSEIQKNDDDLIPVMGKIKDAIKKKDYHCYYSGILEDYTIKKLENLGYKVEYRKGGGNQLEPDFYKISWK